jgi:tetratricopeptide (TPR) repeat protein
MRTPLFALSFLLLGAVTRGALADPVPRDRADSDDVGQLRRHTPEAARLLEQGESLLVAGQAEEALGPLAQASALAPRSALVARRQCEALTALHRQEEALVACHAALGRGGNAQDMRATVAALMRAGGAPTPEQLAEAVMLTTSLGRFASGEPWPHAARCDIAERLGDWSAVRACLGELQRVAPTHPETIRVMNVMRAHRPAWYLSAGWVVILAGCAATLLHALGRGWARIRHRATRTVPALVCLALGLSWSRPSGAEGEDSTAKSSGVPAVADRLSQWPINEKDPESSVPTPQQRDSEPLQYGYHLMDLTDRAEASVKRGDHAAAVKYWRALAKAVPDNATAFRKMCVSYQALGDWDKAVASCNTAVYMPGSKVEDFRQLAALLVAKKTDLAPLEIGAVDKVIQHLEKKLPQSTVPYEIECQLGLRLQDRARLQHCTDRLGALAPEDPKTLSLQWAYALQRKDYGSARELLDRAKTAAISPEDLHRMQEATRTAEPLWRRSLTSPWVWSATALGLLGAAAFGRLGRRRMTAATS